MKFCKVCGKPEVKAHGLCVKHYNQLLKYGKTMDNNPRTVWDKNEIRVLNNYVEIDTYENELIQIYINILNNSIDAFMEVNYNKYIFIETKKVNSHLIIEIKDNAGGIADDVIGKVFEPYFSTKDEKNGTGLGLYMCNEIVTKHLKGTISVQTVIFDYLEKNYTGASFKITLQL